MSGATVNSGAGEKPQSAFSAVVRKSFSSFSVDSILSGGGGGGESRSARHADEGPDGEHRSPLSFPGTAHTAEFLLREERGGGGGGGGEACKKDREGSEHTAPSSPGCEDDERDEEDIHVDTDPEDEKERDAAERLHAAAQPVIRPTALGPLQDPRLTGLGHPGPPPPHTLLPPHLQAGLWPSLPLLHHQLSLRALNSKCRPRPAAGVSTCPGRGS